MSSVLISLLAASRPQIAHRSKSATRPSGNAPPDRVRLLLAIFSVALSCFCGAGVAGAQIIHISYSPVDQWVQCVTNVLGKPLVLNFEGYRSPSCPQTIDDLNAQLKDKGLLVRGDKWDFILGKGHTTPLETSPEFWRDVEVSVYPRPWISNVEGSRRPTEAELKELGESAMRVIRPGVWIVSPIAPKRDRGAEQPGDRTAKFELDLLFDIHRLSPNGPESITGILRSSKAIVSERLIYGEYRNGKPTFLWDSPSIAAFDAGLEYYSVRNDQTEDIVVKGVLYCGNRSCAHSLVVFAKDGWEVTRQITDNCQDGATCPIRGGGFKFVRQSNPGSGVPDRIEVHEVESGAQPNDVYLLGSANLFEKQPRHSPSGKKN